jgi:hypothetical protein
MLRVREVYVNLPRIDVELSPPSTTYASMHMYAKYKYIL